MTVLYLYRYFSFFCDHWRWQSLCFWSKTFRIVIFLFQWFCFSMILSTKIIQLGWFCFDVVTIPPPFFKLFLLTFRFWMLIWLNRFLYWKFGLLRYYRYSSRRGKFYLGFSSCWYPISLPQVFSISVVATIISCFRFKLFRYFQATLLLFIFWYLDCHFEELLIWQVVK